jgi:hypothetical protein
LKSAIAIVGACGVLALTIGLAGCNARGDATDGGGGLALTGSKYCNPFKPTSANTSSGLATATAADPAATFDDCLHRWAYTLAPDHDPADVVAHAAVDACGSILTQWNQQTLPPQEQPSSRRESRGAMAQSQDSALAQRMRMVESRALFYVVQARAAGCAPPPANTLVASTGY